MSYRREEASVHAGWLHDEVESHLGGGGGNVFIDVDLEPAVDFVARLTEVLDACRVMLVVIGPRWATVETSPGRRRLFEERDFVRFEVETALRRPDVKVLPLLVAGANMPDPSELPESLRSLPDLNGLRVSDDLRSRRDDVRHVLTTLDDWLAEPTGTEPAPIVEESNESPSIARPLIEGILVAAAAGLAGGLLGSTMHPGQASENSGKVLATVVQRSITWAIVGAAIAVWITILRGESRAIVGRGLAGVILGALAGAVGGAIYGGAAYLPDDISSEAKQQIQIGALAATGGVLGAFLGRLWIPPRTMPGLLAGAAGGALAQLILKAGEWNLKSAAVSFRCIFIVTFVLATMFALDALRATAAPGAGVEPAT
jgi:hypothetical protein